MPDANALVAIGRVGRAHGVHGEVRVVPYNEATELLDPGARIRIADAEYRIRGSRSAGGARVVTLEGVETREAAEQLTGAEVSVPRGRLPAARPDELYLVDLVGCTCAERTTTLGEVVGVATYPASTCLVVESEAGVREIPAVAPYLVDVDLAARRIEIAHAEDFPLERPRARKPERPA